MNEEIRKLGNEKIRKLKNEVEATRNALAEGLSVYSTLPKFETLAKCVPQKRCVGTVRRIRKETEKNRSESGGILVKKGCKEGEVSL